MMSLLGCPRMAQKSATSKVKALIQWRKASRDEEIRAARTSAFRDMVSLLGIQYTSDFITILFVEEIDIPREWRSWLAEARKTARKQPIPSSSMSTSFTEVKGQSLKSQERLATFGRALGGTLVSILNPECSDVEIELQLPEREFTNVFTFQDKLVFIGGCGINADSKRVDLMDITTGQVSSLPDMIKTKCFPVGVGTEKEIFVFGTRMFSYSSDCFSKEVYDAALGR
ncbi:unnamed protein product [Hymenolepis diminuta]|nr:unnamed protein product [Hymenolepis diminuta]